MVAVRPPGVGSYTAACSAAPARRLSMITPADVVRDAGGGRTSTEARRPDICDKLQMKCNSLLLIHERADPGFRSPAGGSPGAG